MFKILFNKSIKFIYSILEFSLDCSIIFLCFLFPFSYLSVSSTVLTFSYLSTDVSEDEGFSDLVFFSFLDDS